MKYFAHLTILLSVLAFVKCSPTPAQNQWAVIVAGSSGYYNYRHQADVAHAYQILLSRGFLKEHIIVMSYDDVASSGYNPYPNKLFNNPSHIDYYHDVRIDYRGQEVTPETFLKVLTGDPGLKAKGKRVLESTANDNVLVNFADHGAPGILAFPEDELSNKDLFKTIKTMYAKKMYKQLLFYVEACESGSMFDQILPNDMNVLALTAANPDESSYAYYFDEELDTFLGDMWSIKWMEDDDGKTLSSKTIREQHQYLVKVVDKSHPQIYGDMKIAALTLNNFFGPNEPHASINKETGVRKSPLAVDSREVDTFYLAKQYIKHVNNPEKREAALEALYQLLQKRKIMNKVMNMLTMKIEEEEQMNRNVPLDFDVNECYHKNARIMMNKCFSIQEVPQVGEKLKVVKNICEKATIEASKIGEFIEHSCTTYKSLML